MEGHRHNQIEVPAAEARIVQRFAQPLADRVTQVALFRVFEFVHNFANQAAAPIRRDSAIEMQDPVLAVRTAEGLGNGALEWFGTFRAEWWNDPRSPSVATRAQIFRLLHAFRANDTRRRIKKRSQRLKDFRPREDQHIATRF